ncbi:hypothetical protein SECTIM467_124 [Brevibacillus phage SecTim467]|uniref:Uncharacterized protein n=2 Tax=Jenstvirus jenst TaxID=1982225 RepID=A0A0K2CP18_9CAUD|nr:hypothetical protein AVV11_gp072 [Brevibacillus phage Jenst]ALA07248.1 hypothetical protein JENST_119 [Brevibacillus phage Jenst]ALA07572.1 hypothetical protein SECTIM467_124 [Brevibacillus phage SecTim467]
MYFKVVKATELDGITIKDSDLQEQANQTGVTKRIGLIVGDIQSIADLTEGRRLIVYDPEDEIHAFLTTRITEVTNGEQIQVKTLNTIYFLERVEA